MKSAFHKDNIKVTTLIDGELIDGGVLVVEGGFYKVLENAKDMKDLEIKIGRNLK